MYTKQKAITKECTATYSCLTDAIGILPRFFRTSRLMPDSTFFHISHADPFFPSLTFCIVTFSSSSFIYIAPISRSSAYSSNNGQPQRNSMDRASNTMMKSSGLRTEPRLTPTLLKPSVNMFTIWSRTSTMSACPTGSASKRQYLQVRLLCQKPCC